MWAYCAWQVFEAAPELEIGAFSVNAWMSLVEGITRIIFLWLLVALAVLDAENLWLPDRLTLPGIFLGFAHAVTRGSLIASMAFGGGFDQWKHQIALSVFYWFFGAVACAGAVLVIRWVYIMFRGHEGIGMGDVKLMAMLGGWLGIKSAVLSFAIAVAIGLLAALIVFARPSARANKKQWGLMKLPLGAFICAGGIVSAFWGGPIIDAYRRLAGI